jgi:tight adherence protein B
VTVLVLTCAVGACTFAAVGLVLASPRRSWVQVRLGPYLPVARRTVVETDSDRGLLGRLGTRVRASAPGGLLARELERAGADWTADRLAAVLVAVSLLAAALALAAGVGPAGSLPVALLAAAAPLAVLRIRARRRARAFGELLPDVLDMLAASLRVGHSFEHALRAVADEAAEPAASEFRRALGEIRLGRPSVDALEAAGRRVSSDDLPFVLAAVEIQHQVGGSLAGLLGLVAGTVRARQQFRRKVRALTGMGRASAGTLLALPIVAGVGLTLIQPGYMAPLWHTATGRLLLAIAGTMMAAGTLVLRKIVSVRG